METPYPYVVHLLPIRQGRSSRTLISRTSMSSGKLSHTVAIILRALSLGYCFGFEIMEATGLPSGTVYPALRRLERDGLVSSKWESEEVALKGQRPARRYYCLLYTSPSPR